MPLAESLIGFLVLTAVVLALSIYWVQSRRDHERHLSQLKLRVMVNGIRGKSTVTRLIGGILRESGYTTVVKTTGSAARVIDPSGEEHPIIRYGAPTIMEQIDIIREYVTVGVEAYVAECMALKPTYQEYSQEHILKPHITIITNVRLDHQEEMGETLEEIADSLAVTIPPGGTLITGEERPSIRDRLRKAAEKRGAHFVYADPEWVREEDLPSFGYLQYRQNIAIGLAIARTLGIGRVVAFRGMQKAVPDTGAIHLARGDIRGKRVLWVPMFAVNDLESVLITFEMLREYYDPEKETVIGILNNRWDRGRRAEEFARLVPRELGAYLDHVITFGGYEEQVTSMLVDEGLELDRITNLGESVDPSLDEILDRIAELIDGDSGVLVGLVNIHTQQADMLRDFFAGQSDLQKDEFELSRDPERMSPSVMRRRRARARPEKESTHDA